MKTLQKHKVPLIVRFYRLKNIGFLTFTDTIIRFIKPSKKYTGTLSKILFIRTDKIGDALVTVPVLRDLKLNYPELIIDVLCSDKNKFVFENLDYINKLHVFNSYRNKENLIEEKYDAVIDLVSIDKKLIHILKKCSAFIAGSRIFLYSWIYDYYLSTNWVSELDKDVMSRKIEKLLTDCFNFKFTKRDTSQPYDKSYLTEGINKEYDLLIHLGTSEIRKFDAYIEEKVIELLADKKILITDGYKSERFIYYQNKFQDKSNIIFKLYPSLLDIASDAIKSKQILCYDGGQAHFLGQFTKCIVMYGSVSPLQWAPYDFSEYELYKKCYNGVTVLKSKGSKGHIAAYFPIWCIPCYGIGCNTRPCINNILPEQVKDLIQA
ncbi:MAG TPA: hypothetical protein VGK25_03250 [Ignavibacteria bacterium]|jgi:ADP-heptose:LPS heptosyltransferase